MSSANARTDALAQIIKVLKEANVVSNQIEYCPQQRLFTSKQLPDMPRRIVKLATKKI
jgi:hypothetical protein